MALSKFTPLGHLMGYVKKGLVYHWTTITSKLGDTKWKDAISGAEILAKGGALFDGYAWIIDNSSGNRKWLEGNAVFSVDKTVEIVGRCTRTMSYAGRFFDAAPNNYRSYYCTDILLHGGRFIDADLSTCIPYEFTGLNGSDNECGTIFHTFNAYEMGTIVVQNPGTSGGKYRIFSNGILCGESTINYSHGDYGMCRFRLGVRNNIENQADRDIDMAVCAIRIYNRILTHNEVALNYSVDKILYGL